jgi:hypothetical protein
MINGNQGAAMRYHSFFKEGFTPQSGIDTISIWIHPAIINKPYLFHEQGNNNEPVNLRFKRETDSKTRTIIRTNYVVDIQAEAINPDYDIFDQILTILTKLAYDDILRQSREQEYNIKAFFQTNFDRLFALEDLDFYHDLSCPR